jgi:hypothetical protein
VRVTRRHGGRGPGARKPGTRPGSDCVQTRWRKRREQCVRLLQRTCDGGEPGQGEGRCLYRGKNTSITTLWVSFSRDQNPWVSRDGYRQAAFGQQIGS